MSPFATRLLDWFDLHGRHDLPWQSPRCAYRVWVSEIMLQQTQVAVVVPYFLRFVERFPDLGALAAAPTDDVLAHWSGLGYYARARNLQKAARVCMEQHGGQLPTSLEALQALPGIGRSTAGAILAQAHGQRVAILDGNAKRVLARHAAVEGWPGAPPVQKALWAVAEAHLPDQRLADYTQAIMDLGATVCRRHRPDCAACPVASDCQARMQGRTDTLPQARPRRETPSRSTWMLVLRDPDGRILVERRPPTGIWGGLWSLPELAAPAEAREWVARHGRQASAPRELDAFEHGFSHFRLRVTPLLVDVDAPTLCLGDGEGLQWHAPDDRRRLGLPAPVARFLDRLHGETS